MRLRTRGKSKTFYIARRVPKSYKTVEKRKQIWLSLNTSDEEIAQQKAPIVWQAMIDEWETKLAFPAESNRRKFELAKKLAAQKGFAYKPMSEVVNLPEDEFFARGSAISMIDGKPNMAEAAALFGAAGEKSAYVSECLEYYFRWKKVEIDRKTPNARRVYQNPYKKAVRTFLELNGDLRLSEISTDHMETFRDHWLTRISDEELKPNSANRDLTCFATVIKLVVEKKKLGFVPPVDGYSFKDTHKSMRSPFSDAWIKEHFLGDNSPLRRLNAEARYCFLGMINTGYRPSEASSLGQGDIVLEAEVPYIDINPNRRQLKNTNSIRKIPLTGISLEAFKECPAGFPRYFDNPSLTATVNKFLKENGLKEDHTTTMYSLRHSFEDRMLVHGVDERIRRDLMGHGLGDRVRYGQGGGLGFVHKQLLKCAL